MHVSSTPYVPHSHPISCSLFDIPYNMLSGLEIMHLPTDSGCIIPLKSKCLFHHPILGRPQPTRMFVPESEMLHLRIKYHAEFVLGIFIVGGVPTYLNMSSFHRKFFLHLCTEVRSSYSGIAEN
jgi:hypothetical protein